MTFGCARAFRLVAAAILSLIAGETLGRVAPAAQAQAQADPPSQPPFSILENYEPLGASRDRGEVLSTLRPVVRRFDFDSTATGANALPPDFFRFIAPSQGFPPFGEMRLAGGAGYRNDGDSAPTTGAGALEFDLAGGSMSARIGPSVIPVLPYADYIVACRTRTEGLTHARTRLVAWLCDAAGREIPGSRSESRCVNTAGAWTTLSLEIHGRFPDAADLVFDLQLVQPQHQSVERLDAAPQVEDVAGLAWFDDVTISHLPRVTLAMEGRDGLITLGQPVRFLVQANEVGADDLRARLRVFDIDGRVVFDRTTAAPRGRQVGAIEASVATCGWYRAVLDIQGRGEITRRRWLDFLVLLPFERNAGSARSPFGVAVADMRTIAASAAPQAIEAMNAAIAIVPAWDRDTTLANLPQQVAARRQFIDHLLRRGIEVQFALSTIPEELSHSAGPSSRTALDVLADAGRAWQPYLDELLLQYGLTIGGWQIDADTEVMAQEETTLPVRVQRATAALAAYAPQPRLHLAWPVQQPAANLDVASPLALIVPHQAQPSSLDDFLNPWLADSDRSTTITLELLPTSTFTPRQRLADAMLRGLYAWRAGAEAIIIDQPWHTSASSNGNAEGDSGSGDIILEPHPEFVAWRTLALQLAGRTFGAELDLGDGVHAWVVRGRDASDAALIAWCDRPSSAGPLPLQIQLSDGVVKVSDTFGNARSLVPNLAGLHTINLCDLPTFIEGISLELVTFRGGVRIEPDFVPAASRIHDRHLVIRNPWDSTVAGSVRLTSAADLAISPAAQEFSIAPHAETRLPLAIVPQRGILAGRKTITAHITVNADRPHALTMDLNVEVGLKDIELNVTWTTAFNPTTGAHDLIISPAATNHSSRVVTLDVDILADGVSQKRRTLAGLQPGQTQTRTFHIANGLALLSGKQVRLGLSERNGVARLNKVITITPGQTQSLPPSHAADDQTAAVDVSGSE